MALRSFLPRFLPVTLALAAVGCGGSAWQREVIYSASGVTIYRERPKEGSDLPPPSFLHPVSVSPEVLEIALGRMGYQERPLFRSAKDLPLFLPQEAKELSLPLSLALRLVGPTERIRFLVTRSNWSAVFVGISGTSAVVFREREGTLDVAFDYVQEKLLGAENGDPAEVVYREEPTEIVGGRPLLPGPGMAIRALAEEPSPDSGEPRSVFPRWFEVSLTEVAAAVPVPPADASPPGEDPGRAAAGEAASGQMASEQKGDDSRYQELRARIETLKKLRADGSLSDAEYERALDRALSEVGKP